GRPDRRASGPPGGGASRSDRHKSLVGNPLRWVPRPRDPVHATPDRGPADTPGGGRSCTAGHVPSAPKNEPARPRGESGPVLRADPGTRAGANAATGRGRDAPAPTRTG